MRSMSRLTSNGGELDSVYHEAAVELPNYRATGFGAHDLEHSFDHIGD
jgi:hypothetical protein